ncbi:3'(2'),5'-bisphosphate nucleotidase [Lutibacter agarilyticus]|uniref:3'(2'),5'-bisphosphate nucleotidase CysQ n=1 Tax=Lutibacter agarilyticus TaxID=1109740 RepID=A0A238WTZ5_9FLAO|nr:3'(2'),5'-bisphosphate nucleotidase CysQ [Lutibacter agarilyticus]SNR50017.1 3'(2'),5'-bisphosphate nucleotidase [Lutibacter agarilyticus]
MKKLLAIAIKAAIEAGIEIMKVYTEDFKVELKSDNSPITIADQNANSVINAYLIKTDIPIISEENKQVDFLERKNWETCWIVDPLDGTKEFVKRNGEFTVNIALIHKNKPVLGVIYVPVTKTLYYSLVEAQKSYKTVLQQHYFSEENLMNVADEIHPSKNSSIIKVVGSRSHNSAETTAFIESIKAAEKKVEIVAKGSSLKFCLLAEGKAQVYPRFAPTMEWDTAAGHAICNAVGLKVMQATGKEELQYNKQNLLNPYFKVQ